MPQPRLARDNALLFICDAQTRLLPAMHEAARLERNLVALATLARRLELPIVVSEQNPAKIGETVSSVAAALGEFSPIPKMRFSAWPDARETIERSGRKTVIMCGVEAHICVAQTALDLIENGYTAFAVYDAIGSRAPHNIEVGWQRMMSAGALASSTEAAIYELLGEAGTDDFRALLPIVKQRLR